MQRSILKAPALALALLAAVALVDGRRAHADETGDKAAVQGVITQQIDAFKHDDAAAAYAFAAPGIKALFPDAAGFLAMVRSKYPPVYRPKTFAFGDVKATDSGLSQTMTIIDGGGEAWTAVYTFDKGPDGQWRITGCVLVKSPEIGA